MAQRSVADSLSVEAGENAWVLVVSYLSMFLYVSLVLGSPCDFIRCVLCERERPRKGKPNQSMYQSIIESATGMAGQGRAGLQPAPRR